MSGPGQDSTLRREFKDDFKTDAVRIGGAGVTVADIDIVKIAAGSVRRRAHAAPLARLSNALCRASV